MTDDGRTRRWDKIPRLESSLDPLQALRGCIVHIKKVPHDFEMRRQMRAIASEQGLWEQLAILLADEARAASHKPDIQLAFYEELVDVYEQLDQMLEMIAALESVVTLDATNADQLDRLAWLYRKAGAWSKAAETFERVGEIGRDNRARAALRAAAQIYREHQKLDRAVETYRTILVRKPSDDEAWRALDDLLTELGRWRELANIRAERASRADGVEKAALLRAQARALEQAGDHAAARELVARASQHAPEDMSGLVDYVDVLARAGQHREAAELLRQRIAGEKREQLDAAVTRVVEKPVMPAPKPAAKPAPKAEPAKPKPAIAKRPIPSITGKSRPPTTLDEPRLTASSVALANMLDDAGKSRPPTTLDDNPDPTSPFSMASMEISVDYGSAALKTDRAPTSELSDEDLVPETPDPDAMTTNAIDLDRLTRLVDKRADKRADTDDDMATGREPALAPEIEMPAAFETVLGPPPAEDGNDDAETIDPDAAPRPVGSSAPHVVPPDDMLALKLRLARMTDAYDPEAAAVIVDEILQLAPEHLGALELFAVQAGRRSDPQAHAAALLRLAAAQPDAAARTATIVEAARRYRDANDHEAAVRAFQEASELSPDDDDLRAELEEARVARVVERATREAATGEVAEAERRLRASLASHPIHLGANLALVDILVANQRLAAAAEHLQATLAAAPEGTPGPKLSPLVHRLATVHAALGDDDEAHTLLHEAHRLDREAVLVTLALGESCFARRIWRQAALHLGSLADHPHASRHARAVAAGLVHAGQAETRALRPANAPKHYQAAVRLDPECAPGWHALAELAMAQGDVAETARCLEREANATTTPRDRLRLFDALGDMARDVLGDAERAERCWSAVATLGDAGVLEKLLVVQRARDARAELGDTCERLAVLVDDPSRRKSLLEEAARSFALGGNLARAREIADRLLAAHPLDAEAIGCASALALAVGDFTDARSMLHRALTAWEATGDRGRGDGKRADLWRRLGDAERQLGDPAAALASYRKAVGLAPESEGALASRRGLVELASSTGRVEQSSLFVLVEMEQAPADVLASARNLAASKQVEDARATYELARALGAPLTAEDQQFFDAHPPRALASDEAYSVQLDAADRDELVDDPSDAPLGPILDLLADFGGLVCPDARTALFDAGHADAKRLSGTSDAAAAALFPQIAKAFGGPPTLLHVSPHGADDATVLLASPPVVVLGSRFARQRPASRADLDLDQLDELVAMTDDRRGDTALRFQLGRIVELTRPRRLYATGTSLEQFRRFVRGLYHATLQGRGGVPPDDVASEAERLRAKLPIALRGKLGEKLAAVSIDALDIEAYRDGCQRAADRVGLLACGDAGVAIDLAGGPRVAPHLVRLASSKRYLAVRTKLRALRAKR